MKKYFVLEGNFWNAYSLCYTTDGTEPDGWKRITRKEAEQLARDERRRMRENPAFAGYASAEIKNYSYFPQW